MTWNKIRFPNMAVTYMQKTNAHKHLTENQHIFRVAPNYTKHEIKEYLTKLYNLNITKVTTINYQGKLKRAFQGRYVYKEKDFKKAIITLAN